MGLRKAAAGTLLVLAAAGCGESQPEAKVTSIGVDKTNPHHEKLQALSPLHRDLALRRAIQDTGGTCQRIEGAAHQGEYQNLQMWTAHCEGGKNWAVFIAPNADVQVRSCDQAQQLGLPECKPPPAG